MVKRGVLGQSDDCGIGGVDVTTSILSEIRATFTMPLIRNRIKIGLRSSPFPAVPLSSPPAVSPLSLRLLRRFPLLFATKTYPLRLRALRLDQKITLTR